MAIEVSGSTRFILVDEDGDELPGRWEFTWESQDPFDVVVAAVTEVSARPWKWSARSARSGRFSPDRCKAMSIRVGKVLRAENRKTTASCVARVIEELDPRHRRRIDVSAVEEALAGKRAYAPEELEGRPELQVAVMLRAFREALKAAVESESGLRVSWREE